MEGIKIFICLECGHIFDEPKICTEKHGLDSPPYETYSACPYCEGTFTKAHECDSCGEWIVGSYIKLNSGERICEDCHTTYELGEEL